MSCPDCELLRQQIADAARATGHMMAYQQLHAFLDQLKELDYEVDTRQATQHTRD